MGWDELLDMLRLAGSLDRMALAVRAASRKQVLRARCTLLNRKDAGRALSSTVNLDGSDNTTLIKKKIDKARDAAKFKREFVIENRNKKLLFEILREIATGKPLATIAENCNVREATLRRWAKTFGNLLG